MELIIKGTPEEIKKALQAISGSPERKSFAVSPISGKRI
jgi:hypothetical protein